MITPRSSTQCGKADYGWLQARYTFSFGHYFDPQLLGYATLRVLNQEVLAPDASFQPRIYPKVDMVNIILDGEAGYRDNEGNDISAIAGEIVLIATQPTVSYSEYNLSAKHSLTRLQLWLDACPGKAIPQRKKMMLDNQKLQLIASPDGMDGSLQLRQHAWIYHIALQKGEKLTLALKGTRAYLQSIHGEIDTINEAEMAALRCGDGAFIRDENGITLVARSSVRAVLIDLLQK